MKDHLNLTIDKIVLNEFKGIYGGSISQFVEQRMAEYIELRRLKWWLFCPKCGQKTHIKVAMSNGGFCQNEDCKARIMEKIEYEFMV